MRRHRQQIGNLLGIRQNCLLITPLLFARFAIVVSIHLDVRAISLTVSASLAQIGEFSFILAGLGVSLGVLPAEGQSLILAGSTG